MEKVKMRIKRTTQNELITLRQLNEDGLNNTEIAKRMNRSNKWVLDQSKKMGLQSNWKIKSGPNANLNYDWVEPKFTELQLEVVFGSLLGDMCIKSDSTAGLHRIACLHGGRQVEYNRHKCEILKPFALTFNEGTYFDERTQKTYSRCYFNTGFFKEIGSIYDSIYINGKKTVTQEWCDKITPRAIAYWFMDDGSKNGVLSCQSFGLEGCLLLQQMLADRFEIKTKITKANELYVTAAERKKFEQLIEPFIVTTMRYKLSKSD